MLLGLKLPLLLLPLAGRRFRTPAQRLRDRGVEVGHGEAVPSNPKNRAIKSRAVAGRIHRISQNVPQKPEPAAVRCRRRQGRIDVRGRGLASGNPRRVEVRQPCVVQILGAGLLEQILPLSRPPRLRRFTDELMPSCPTLVRRGPPR